MEKKKIAFVFGTRPEAIKLAPLILHMKTHELFEPLIITTGQHREMLNQVLDIFEIQPEYNLSIMEQKQTLSDITTKALFELEAILKKEKPECVLVHGDTTTSLAASLAAFYQQIKIGHVEAGLRTNNISNPFPEEGNRQLISRLATYHFAPTSSAEVNLFREGITEGTYVTGNTAIDTLKYTVNKPVTNDLLKKISSRNTRMVLLTIHRRENLDCNMDNIFSAVREVIDRREDVEVVFPMHMNPLIRKKTHELLAFHPRIHLIEPLEVVEFHQFMRQATFIITDSGGVQEEAPTLGTPVLVAREKTERPEGLLTGNLELVGVDTRKIIRKCLQLLDDQVFYKKMSKPCNPYGDGFSSEKICNILERNFFSEGGKESEIFIPIKAK